MGVKTNLQGIINLICTVQLNDHKLCHFLPLPTHNYYHSLALFYLCCVITLVGFLLLFGTQLPSWNPEIHERRKGSSVASAIPFKYGNTFMRLSNKYRVQDIYGREEKFESVRQAMTIPFRLFCGHSGWVIAKAFLVNKSDDYCCSNSQFIALRLHNLQIIRFPIKSHPSCDTKRPVSCMCPVLTLFGTVKSNFKE